jgi:hypothetical protein
VNADHTQHDGDGKPILRDAGLIRTTKHGVENLNSVRWDDLNERCWFASVPQGRQMPLFPVEVVSFQEFRAEILWRRGDVRSTVWRKVHEIPIRPHRVNVIPREFSSPEMEDCSIALHEHMHHWPLHVV